MLNILRGEIMPRIDINDLLYEDTFYNDSDFSFSTLFVIAILGLGVFGWLIDLFESKNKINYIGKSISAFFAYILQAIIGAILSVFMYLYLILGLHKDNNTKDVSWVTWLYRLAFAGCIIVFLVNLLTK